VATSHERRGRARWGAVAWRESRHHVCLDGLARSRCIRRRGCPRHSDEGAVAARRQRHAADAVHCFDRADAGRRSLKQGAHVPLHRWSSRRSWPAWTLPPLRRSGNGSSASSPWKSSWGRREPSAPTPCEGHSAGTDQPRRTLSSTTLLRIAVSSALNPGWSSALRGSCSGRRSRRPTAAGRGSTRRHGRRGPPRASATNRERCGITR
jgi:hypothetical protein